ncbi:MAG: carbohydrate kinase family protein, partial [bacterium]|nr:carbohydrate kinase family protein [bacterium]
LKAKAFVDKVVDELGAGDAFSSGFVTGLIKGMPLEESLKLGIANGASAVGKMGGKQGLLYEYEVEAWMSRDLVIEQI